MTTADTTTAEANDSIRNGVDTATLFATLDAVKQAPEAASFQFRAHNQWVSGTHNRGTIADYFGVGEERTHEHDLRLRRRPPRRPGRPGPRARPRWSSCCTRWPPASPLAWPTSPPPEGEAHRGPLHGHR